jgi:predicted DNA-binding transcriptional regulator AlpA
MSVATPQDKATLTRYEAAAFVGLSQRAFDERIGTTFPPIKIGRRTMFLRATLLAVLAKLERQAKQKEPRPLQKKKAQGK